MTLPKHLRPRWRYLGVGIETWAGTDLDRDAVQRALWYAGANLLGDPGSADADLSVVRFDHDAAAGEGEAAVRTRRDETGPARAALACVTDVDGAPVGVRVRGVSGTLRSCEERYLGRAPSNPQERTVVFDGTERPARARNGRVDLFGSGSSLGATGRDIDT